MPPGWWLLAAVAATVLAVAAPAAVICRFEARRPIGATLSEDAA